MSEDICGVSVTIPHKKRVIPLLDDISAVAEALEAVNSISVENGTLHGHNTDIYGFSLPLRPLAQKLKHGSALILGCGGSARAIIYSLYTDYEVSEFHVLGRSDEKLKRFRAILENTLRNSAIKIITYNDWADHKREDFDIVVNCTPLGGWNHPNESPIPSDFDWGSVRIYYDLNYNEGNKIVQQAIEGGVLAFDGSQMLVGQAVRSFDIWTGLTVDFDQVYEQVFDKTRQSV
jgi:shikimate dehydrogenase